MLLPLMEGSQQAIKTNTRASSSLRLCSPRMAGNAGADAFSPVLAAAASGRRRTKERKAPKAYLTTFFWEEKSTLVYQLNCNDVPVCRRKDNNYINGTKLLNISVISRGKRDSILKLEKERDVIKKGETGIIGETHPLFEKDPESLVLSSDSVSSIASLRTLSTSLVNECTESKVDQISTLIQVPQPISSPVSVTSQPSKRSSSVDENKKRLTMTLRSHSFKQDDDGDGISIHTVTTTTTPTTNDSYQTLGSNMNDSATPSRMPVSMAPLCAASTDDRHIISSRGAACNQDSVSAAVHTKPASPLRLPTLTDERLMLATPSYTPLDNACMNFAPSRMSPLESKSLLMHSDLSYTPSTSHSSALTLAQMTPQYSPFTMHPYYPNHEIDLFTNYTVFAPDFPNTESLQFIASTRDDDTLSFTSVVARPLGSALGDTKGNYNTYNDSNADANEVSKTGTTQTRNSVLKRLSGDSQYELEHTATKRLKVEPRTDSPAVHFLTGAQKSLQESLSLFCLDDTTDAPTNTAQSHFVYQPILTTKPNPFDQSNDTKIMSLAVNIHDNSVGHKNTEYSIGAPHDTAMPSAIEMLDPYEDLVRSYKLHEPTSACLGTLFDPTRPTLNPFPFGPTFSVSGELPSFSSPPFRPEFIGFSLTNSTSVATARLER